MGGQEPLGLRDISGVTALDPDNEAGVGSEGKGRIQDVLKVSSSEG